MNCFGDWTFENSDLFGIWCLRFGISSLRGKSACEGRSSIYHSRVTFSRSGGGMADTYV